MLRRSATLALAAAATLGLSLSTISTDVSARPMPQQAKPMAHSTMRAQPAPIKAQKMVAKPNHPMKPFKPIYVGKPQVPPLHKPPIIGQPHFPHHPPHLIPPPIIVPPPVLVGPPVIVPGPVIAPLIAEPVVAPVVAPTVAPVACTCLTKEYTPTGAVLFRDNCTNEAAISPPQQTGMVEPAPGL